jgi:hypothetical protein
MTAAQRSETAPLSRDRFPAGARPDPRENSEYVTTVTPPGLGHSEIRIRNRVNAPSTVVSNRSC